MCVREGEDSVGFDVVGEGATGTADGTGSPPRSVIIMLTMDILVMIVWMTPVMVFT